MGKVVDSLRRRRRLAPVVAASFACAVALWGSRDLAAPRAGAPAPDAPARDRGARDLPGLVETARYPARGDGARAPGSPRFEWRLVDGRSWQIAGPPGEDPRDTDAREGNRGACPTGMIEVAGKMKLDSMLDELQLGACTAWIDRKWPERCAAYDRAKWLAIVKDVPTKPMRFCVDRFEYPNRRGEYPIVDVSWYEARDTCHALGKRLCTEDEWTFACEGEEATPYPDGYVRTDACVRDRPWIAFRATALADRASRAAMLELDRLWQGAPSGSRPLCKSAFGVYDLTGNVDEWTRSSVPGERPSVLKGGYWGPVRTRCRPATKAHDETHSFYQQGFRCCADAR